jgi:LssY C-terminus
MVEDQHSRAEDKRPSASSRRITFQRAAGAIVGLLILYLLGAYVLAPRLWIRYARRHPSFNDIPGITLTGDDHPGDPLNVALIGTETELKKVMLAAKWYPADPLTLRSCLEIAEASVLKRRYDDAPVSNLYLFGRKQDLAFQQPVGDNPRHRHHVRFWRTPLTDPDGRPAWIGSAIYDRRVGLNRTSGQITHVTAPDIDKERDYLFHDLEQTGQLSEFYVIDGFHTVLEGKNGGGDPWYTDGKLYVGVIVNTVAPAVAATDRGGRSRVVALPPLRGFNAALAGRTLRYIRQGMDESILRALIARNGGEWLDLAKLKK